MKAAIEREATEASQRGVSPPLTTEASDARISYPEREQARPQVKSEEFR